LKKIAVWLLALMVCAQAFTPGTKSFASPAEEIVMLLSTSKSHVKSGEEFDYRIGYSFSATVGNYSNPSISLALPPGVTYTGRTNNGITTSTVSTGMYGTTVVTFTFNDGILPAGMVGDLFVKAKFENYVTPDGTSATAKAVFSATDDDGTVTLDSNEVTVASQASAPWSIDIKRTLPAGNPMKGSDAHYEITLEPYKGDGKGLLDIENVSVIATLADGATFVSADNGGTPGLDHTVTWYLGDGIREARTLKLAVHYDESITADQVTTSAEMSATPLGQVPSIISSSTADDFAASPDDAGTIVNLYSNEQERSPGQTVKLRLNELSNQANLSLDQGVLELMTPTNTVSGTPIQLRLQTIKSAIFSGIADYDLYYTFADNPTAGDWTLCTSLSANSAITIDAIDIGDIKGIQVRFATLPLDWSQESDFEFTYLIDPAVTVPPNTSESIRSSATFEYVFNGAPKSSSDDSVTTIVNSRPLLELRNTVSKPSAAPVETVNYVLSVTNDDQLSSDTLDNPMMYAILPAELEYVPGSWLIVKPLSLPADPTFMEEVQPSGATKLSWSWDDSNPGELPMGDQLHIQYEARIKPGTAVGTVTNTFGVQSPDYLNDVHYRNPTPVNGVYSVEATSSITVTSSAALQSRMQVKGELDASWSDTGTTTPGGLSSYRLEVLNVGNVELRGLVLVNPFPRIGDTHVLNSSIQRGSQWGPLLMGAVQAPSHVTVQYSTKSGITMNPATASDNGVWTTSLPADPTSVTAIKLIMNPDYVIHPLDQTTLEWTMRAPVGAPTGGELAWSSYAYRAIDDSWQLLAPAESNKVGMSLQSSPRASIGDFVWLDSNENGGIDGAESGINGVTVELYDGAGAKLAETVTSHDFGGQPGAYLFPNLEPGEYRVVFNPGSPYATVSSELVTLGAGDNHLTLDTGIMLQKGKIGSFVWIDANENGLQDAGESGLDGVTVKVYDGSGTLMATTTTATHDGQSGRYVFEGLSPGDYQVEFLLPSTTDYEFTAKSAGADPTIDSDADPVTGKTAVFPLALGEENLAVDAGIVTKPAPPPENPTSPPENPTSPPPSTLIPTPPEPEPEPEQQQGPSKEILKGIVDQDAFLAKLEERVKQANQSQERVELTDLQGHWARDAIRTFIQLGYVQGYSDGSFVPDGEITRAEFATILSRMIDFNGNGGGSAAFTDVGNHWAKQDIAKLSGAGIVQGYSNGSFLPNRGISREEAVIIISRLINLDALDKVAANGSFNDLSEASAYARNEVQKAAEVGIVQGKAEGIFDPRGTITRAEAVMLLMNVLKLHPEAKKLLESLGLSQ